MGLLQVLWFPPTVHRREVMLTGVPKLHIVCEYMYSTSQKLGHTKPATKESDSVATWTKHSRNGFVGV